jgi:uncharacterized pyridoxamine 5'-phosphate oxidase family protein
MTVLIQGISISKTSGNKKTKSKKTSIKYDGKKANIMCSNNGKKSYHTLTNNQLISLMAMPASKKTLKQRLGHIVKKRNAGGTKKKRKQNRGTKKRRKKRKRNKNKGKKN